MSHKGAIVAVQVIVNKLIKDEKKLKRKGEDMKDSSGCFKSWTWHMAYIAFAYIRLAKTSHIFSP